MSKHKHFIFLSMFFVLLCPACDKHDTFLPQGGLLPTNYISIRDNAFDPLSLTVANGSSITFLNQAAVPLTIISDDSTTFIAIIPPDSSFVFKPAASATIPGPTYLPYHCVERSTARGTIIINQ